MGYLPYILISKHTAKKTIITFAWSIPPKFTTDSIP